MNWVPEQQADTPPHVLPGRAMSGLRVLDLSRILAGPLATMWMADLGADVLKVEQPDVGDETRRWGPPFLRGQSAYYLAVNRGKRGITLDLTDPRSRPALDRLLAQSDVLVHNYLPDTALRLGIDDATVRSINPQLVRATVAGFPPGRFESSPGFDALIQAMGGLMAITGARDRPVKIGVAMVDVLTAWAVLAGTLAALLTRTRTGEGQTVPLTLVECSAAALANVGQDFLITGKEPQRLSTAHPHIVPYQAFPAQDGLLMVAVGSDAQFARLCSVVGHEQIAHDPRFATNAARVAHRDLLVTLLSKVFARHPRAHWRDLLADARVPASPVNGLEELFGDPALTGRLLVTIEHPTAGRYTSVACPLPQAWPASRVPPPLLGEHNATVLVPRVP